MSGSISMPFVCVWVVEKMPLARQTFGDFTRVMRDW